VDVEAVLEKHSVDFREKGADFIVRCLNPEHDDNNPSMRIDKIHGTFHCFSCGFKGNIYSHFSEESNSALSIARLKFEELLENKMSESVGLKVPSHFVKYSGTWRNISQDTYDKFEAYVSAEPEYAGRIIFPIRDFSNRLVAFIGRTTNSDVPKYRIWPRKAKIPMYPFFSTIKNSVILVEGIYDAMNLYDKGLPNAICAFGTNNVQTEKLQLLKMSGVTRLVIFFDGDEAGRKAADKVESLSESIDLPTKIIRIRDKDPGELSLTQIRALRSQLYG